MSTVNSLSQHSYAAVKWAEGAVGQSPLNRVPSLCRLGHLVKTACATPQAERVQRAMRVYGWLLPMIALLVQLRRNLLTTVIGSGVAIYVLLRPNLVWLLKKPTLIQGPLDCAVATPIVYPFTFIFRNSMQSAVIGFMAIYAGYHCLPKIESDELYGGVARIVKRQEDTSEEFIDVDRALVEPSAPPAAMK